MVSHDIEFCAEYADRCALVFDGGITSSGTPRDFFNGNSFYTTSANRMARTRLPDAVLAEDIILACGGKPEKRERKPRYIELHKVQKETLPQKKVLQKLTPARMIIGSIFALAFALISLSFLIDADIVGVGRFGLNGILLVQIINIVVAFFCLFPQKDMGIEVTQVPKSDRKLSGRTLVAAFLILLMIPLTIYFGIFFLGDRKYYFISLLIILETMIPFCMVFESRKPKARELIVISVLCGLAVAGRWAFFMLPQFKPVVAMVIIAGVCFGGETGFLVGAVTGFVSNFFFGQGPWTPWQMFAMGIIGFIAGILFRKGFLRKSKASLCVFGFFATLLIYGGIMNPSSVIMAQSSPTLKMLVASYAAGLPMDIVHSVSTAFFLWFLSEPMIDKLERVKVKYGLIER
jgi:energy-coupling factor transport system ATP-binding protein